jgi:putative transport protein
MHFLVDLLAQNQLLLLFVVIGIGFFVGNIQVGGFRLGVAAVLFVGIAFGAVDRRLDLPEHIYVIGLVLFVYAIGLQAGPSFFVSFQKRGARANMAVISLLFLSAVVLIVIWKILHLPGPAAVGLFCGALTNTPALAATVETVKSLTAGMSPQAAEMHANSPVITYGLAYPFGVLGVILWLFVAAKVYKIDFTKEAKESQPEEIIRRIYRITNPALIGKTAKDLMATTKNPGFVLSRIKKRKETSIVYPETVFSADDRVIVVGTEEALERARLFLGEQSREEIDHGEPIETGFMYRRVFVSNNEVVGKSLEELDLERRFDATITRLRRGDVDFVPALDTTLELGDRIRVVTRRHNIDRITAFFGDSVKSISETDFLSLSLGIVLGVFLGMIPIPLPNGSIFRLGFAGGPLIMGLILGRLERTSVITWSIPFSANLVLRQVGLVFFLAAIGTKAGHGFVETFRQGGLSIILAGAVLTTFISLSSIYVGYKFLKLPMSAVMGMVTGLQTQPACLAYANQQAKNELPNVWYATVYPAAMIAKIFLAQILVTILIQL